MNASSVGWAMVAVAGVCVGAASTLIIGWPGAARATPGSNFNSEILSRALFEGINLKTRSDVHQVTIKTRGASDVYVVVNKVPAGGHSGWHTHPGPSVVSVKAGTATVYDGDDPTCTPTQYAAGSGFVDPGGGHVHMVRNQGDVELQTVSFQVVPAGADRRIDMPDPGFCQF